MAFIDWTQAEFSVLHSELDDQHKELFEIVNRFHTASKNPIQPVEILKLFDELIQYTVFHFTYEENYMASMNFPGLENHKELHRSLVKKVVEIKSKFEKNSSSLEPEIMNFLKIWLITHIQGNDKKYGVFALKTGRGKKVA